MKRLLLGSLVFVGLLLSGCVKEDDTIRVLQDQGYTEVQITGYRAFACGDDYTFHTGFSAKAPNTHRPVTGTVCSGFLKGNSIKLD